MRKQGCSNSQFTFRSSFASCRLSVLWCLFGSSLWEAGVFLVPPDMAHIFCQQQYSPATLFRVCPAGALLTPVLSGIQLQDPSPWSSSPREWPRAPARHPPAPGVFWGRFWLSMLFSPPPSYPEVWAKTEDSAMCGGVRICELASKPFWAWRWVTRGGLVTVSPRQGRWYKEILRARSEGFLSEGGGTVTFTICWTV